MPYTTAMDWPEPSHYLPDSIEDRTDEHFATEIAEIKSLLSDKLSEMASWQLDTYGSVEDSSAMEFMRDCEGGL